MSRTSETQEITVVNGEPCGAIAVPRHRMKCPQPCNKTQLVDGKLKCARQGCGREYTVAELYADLILHEVITPLQFKEQLHHALPIGEDAPAHKRARELFGERFIGLHEVQMSVHMSGMKCVYGDPFVYAQYALFPYSWSTLEKCAKNGWWLIPTPPRPDGEFFVEELGSEILCRCAMHYGDWRAFNFASYEHHLPTWLLAHITNIRINASEFFMALSPKEEFRVAHAAEIAYFMCAMSLSKMKFSAKEDLLAMVVNNGLWCASHGDEQPVFRFCKEGNRYYFSVYPRGSYLNPPRRYTASCGLSSHLLMNVCRPERNITYGFQNVIGR